MKTVIAALSGGVDSSVAALLLKEQGHRVIGMTLKTWGKELCDIVPKQQSCCSAQDIEDAQAVASQLDIPFYVVEAADVFQAQIKDAFVASYAAGETPNPCVTCNRDIKVGILLERAKALGADAVATGHYAQVVHDEGRGRFVLRRGVDTEKDQSYVLSQLPQSQLEKLMLPIGHLSKQAVREKAVAAGLKVAQKAESQELCFIPDNDTQKFLKTHTPESFVPGPIVNQAGEILGQHQGIGAYTVGQRKGLGIGHPVPLHVLEIQPETNTIVVGEADALKADHCFVQEVHWSALDSCVQPIQAMVKIRYRSESLPARLIPEDNGVRVEFMEPVAGGISPGQAAVFYDGDVLLGGGWISKGLRCQTQPLKMAV